MSARTLRRRGLPLAAVVLAGLAVVLHLPALDPPVGLTDFSQGAYRPLLRAEAELAAGHAGQALAAYQVAAMRAIRCGRDGVFDRIRLRLGSAGRQLAEKNRAGAWSLLSRYALWSQNFDAESRTVESWLLTRPGWGPEFAYPVVLEDGRTVWNDKPQWVSLGVPEKILSPEKRGLLTGYSVAQAPAVTGWRDRFTLYPIGWAHCTQGSDTSLRLVAKVPDACRWYLRLNGTIQWDAPLPPGPQPPTAPGASRDWSLAAIVAIGQSPPPFTLALIHRYRPL